jgi:hypothetical protein
MSTGFIKDKKGNEKFEAFELVKLMTQGVQLIDGRFDKRFPLVCAAGMRIKGKLDLNKLEKAVNKGYRDIDTMRSVLNMDNPDDLYFKIKESYEYKLNEKVPEGVDAEERYANAQREVQFNVFQREYYKDCACRIEVYKLDENDHFFTIAIEHGMADGQAMLLVLKKLILDYIGLPGGGKINKRSLLDFYEFFEEFKHNGVMEQNTAYWTKEAEGLDGLYKYNEPLENNTITEEEKLVIIPMSTIKQAGKNYKTTAGNLVIAAYMAAVSKVYGTNEAAITCISANRSVPEFFDTAVLQLDPMLLRTSVPKDDTDVKTYLKSVMMTTSEGMKHTPSFYSKVPYSRFLFSYAQDLTKGMSVTNLPGVEVTSWLPQTIPEHVFDVNYIFLIAFEQKDTMELHFALDDTIFCRTDFIKLADTMKDFFERLASQKDLTMKSILS